VGDVAGHLTLPLESGLQAGQERVDLLDHDRDLHRRRRHRDSCAQGADAESTHLSRQPVERAEAYPQREPHGAGEHQQKTHAQADADQL
jgi:hypothetical protein